MIARWYFRTASASRWGAGHMARCLPLAHAMQKAMPGAEIVFLLDRAADSWQQRLAKENIATADGVSAGTAFGLILDHPDPQDSVPRTADLTVCIDDDGRGWSGVDLVIHPHPGRCDDQINGSPALCGAEYALIDPSWRNLRPPGMTAKVQSVLVAFGMVDSVNATGAVMSALQQAGGEAIRVNVAIGSAAPHRSAVELQASGMSGCRLHVGLADIRPLVAGADIVIGAAGVSLLERLAAGAVNLVVAQNAVQAGLAQVLVQSGSIVIGGVMPDFSSPVFIDAYRQLCGLAARRESLSATGRTLIDGLGASRVARHLANLAGYPTALDRVN